MKYDVGIIGGGPAGGVAALVLARAGYSVALMDDADGNALKVGDSLPGAARRILGDLDLLHLLEWGPHLTSHGTLAGWGEADLGSMDFIRDPYGPGMHLDRARFDADLREAAIKEGVEHLPIRIHQIGGEAGNWYLQSRWQELEARYLVDASGRRAFVARALGVKRTQDEGLIALCSWYRAAEQDRDLRSLVESASKGWWYTARLPHEMRIAIYHVHPDIAPAVFKEPGIWMKALEETKHVSSLIEQSRHILGPRACDARGAYLEQAQGKGWLAVGDAALAFDPLSSQGIFNALYTGMRGGQAVIKALEGDPEPQKHYQHRIEKIRGAYRKHVNLYYAMEGRQGEGVWTRG